MFPPLLLLMSFLFLIAITLKRCTYYCWGSWVSENINITKHEFFFRKRPSLLRSSILIVNKGH
uniref:ATP synthase F0 subunit 8 n=1 Tax=Cannabis sativa TaxID=3483 RepID=A0A803R5M6_CANSA